MIDPLLDHFLPTSRPQTFDALPREDRSLRGRYFLMVWAVGASTPFAWAVAMSTPVRDLREVVTQVPDSMIRAALLDSELERGDGTDALFMRLGDPDAAPADAV
jgi:hypothetical protein